MGTSAKFPRTLAAVSFLVFLALLFAQKAGAQATITTPVGVTSTVYLDIGGPYGYTDLTAVTGASDLVVTSDAGGGDLQIGGTISLILPSTSWEWVPGSCVATVSGGGGNVTFTTPVNAQTLVATLNAGAIPALGNITFTVLAARCVASVDEAIAATAIAATTNTMTNMTNAVWGTTIAAVAGPSLTFTTTSAFDSTALADADGGWDLPVTYTITTNTTSAAADMQLWWSVDPDLTSANDEEGAFRALRDSTNVEVNLWIDVSTSPTSSTPLAHMLSDWDVYGTEYYLYATSGETGSRVIGSFGPIRAFHYPTNNLNQDDPNAADATFDFTSNNNDYLDSGGLLALDDGTQDGSGVDNVTWNLNTIDFDSNADVKLYYSTVAGLDEGDLTLGGAYGSYLVTGLTGATIMAGTDTLEEDVDFDWNWDVYTSDTEFIPAGTYYLYIVSNDGYRQDVDASLYQMVVSHSPKLVIQDPYPDGATAIFNLRPDVNRYFNINWGLTIGGDTDPDNAATIAFYLDSDANTTADFSQATIATLTATGTATDNNIANGELIYTVTINENPDGQLDNLTDVDMWGWTEALRASINTQVAAAENLFLYGIITSGSLSRITTYASEDVNYVVTAGEDLSDGTGAELTCTNAQDAFITDPPDLGGSVGWGEAYRIAWDFAWDFGEANQNVLLYVGNENMRADATFNGTFGTGVLGLVDLTNNLWVGNSTDGTVAGNTGTNVITGLSKEAGFNFQPHLMTGNSVGAGAASSLAAAVTDAANLYVYLVVSSSAAGVAPGDADLVFQAPGTLFLESDAGATAFGYKLMPNQLSVVQGQNVAFDIYVDSGVPTAEIATVFMSCDTTYWDVVTPTAPFTLNTTTFSAARVVENSNDEGNLAGGRHHLNFVYGAVGAADANLDGGTNYLCRLNLRAKHTGIINAVSTELYFDQDPPNGRWTTFYDGNANPMPVMVMLPAAAATSYPLGELQGNVELEGINDFTGMVATISVSPSGAIQGVEAWDSLFETTNDGDATLDGCQVTLDQAGHYHLRNVPDGEYDFTVHVDGWLDGTINVQVQHGDHLGDIDPIYTQRITQGLGQQRLELLAGDCAGYTDADGDTRPDNQVDATDLTAVKNAYNTEPGDLAWNALCDFEQISTPDWVYIPDLALVNANQGTAGVPLVYRPTGRSNDGVGFEILNAPEFVSAGQEFSVDIQLNGAVDVRALDVRLSLPGLQVVATDLNLILGPHYAADYLTKNTGEELIIAGAKKGREVTALSGSDRVASVRLVALEDGRPQMLLTSGSVVNSGFEMELAQLDNAGVLPSAYSLGEAYPNPFNPVTRIEFALPEAGLASLKVFNIMGQQVATLVNQQLSAGRHMVSWDATNEAGLKVASGMYVYQLEVNGFTQSHKMLLMK
jgi:hypothetical protein